MIDAWVSFSIPNVPLDKLYSFKAEKRVAVEGTNTAAIASVVAEYHLKH